MRMQKKSFLYLQNQSAWACCPTGFQDNNEPPEYNNVDGTLWYFNAVYAYLQKTNDRDFILNEILPVLKDIIGLAFQRNPV